MKRIQLPVGAYFHVSNRGIDKKLIFSEPTDYKRFIAYLFLLNTQEKLRATDLIDRHGLDDVLTYPIKKPLVAIGAYCLTPQAFHIYMTPLIKGGLSKFMQRLQTAYTMFFNEQRGRSGVLFQGAFKVKNISREIETKFIFSYIHLNAATIIDPDWVSMDARDFLRVRDDVSTYPYSSLHEYISKRHAITDPSKFPTFIAGTRGVDDQTSLWIRSRDEGLKSGFTL